MSAAGKNSISFRKKDLQDQRSIAIGFKKTIFAHKATTGDTGITLSSLVTPSEMSSVGFVNPSASDIVNAQLFFYQKNLTLMSSLRGELIPYLSYTISSSNRIVFNGFTAADGEIFVGVIDFNAVTGTQVVDATFATATGTMAIGATDFNVGQAFAINQYPSQQVGAVLVFRNGQQQFRCIGNNAANEGNYTEVDNGSGLGQIIRFVVAAPGPTEGDSILVVSNGLVAYAPDNSALQQIETLAGQIDDMIPTLAALAGVPESDFQSAPNNVDLKSFGDQVFNHESRLDVIEKYEYIELNTIGGTSNGSTNTAIRRFLNVNSTTTNGIVVYADSATLGASFTAQQRCLVTISYSDNPSAASDAIGLSRNTTQATTNIGNITVTDRLVFQQAYTGGASISCTWTGVLQPGDVLRPHGLPGMGVSNTARVHCMLTARIV